MKAICTFRHSLTGSNDSAQDYNCLGDMTAVFLIPVQPQSRKTWKLCTKAANYTLKQIILAANNTILQQIL